MSKPKFKIGDKVRILDGSEIKGYTGGFPSDMARLVGKIATVRSVEPWPGGRIAYLLEGVKNVGGYYWDERGLEPAARAKEKIVIYREGRSVFAMNILTGKIAEAKCNPEDQFIFRIGAELAFDRLMGREEKKPEKPKYYTGKVVCIKTGFGPHVDVDVTWWTVGKIYDVINGVIVDDDGDSRSPAGSLEELNQITADYAEFIALADPKPEEPKLEEPKYYNGKVVCVERGPGKLGSLEVTGTYWWTVGKVYDVVNGVIRDDDGDYLSPVKTLDELNEREDKYAKFIALVE